MPVHYHKHLSFVLDSKMNYIKHIDGKTGQANQGIGLIKRLYNYLPRTSLIQIYKSFIRLHLDYCDVSITNLIMMTFVVNITVNGQNLIL